MAYSSSEFKSLAKLKTTGLTVVKEYFPVVQPLGDRQLKFIISTETVDRSNDVVKQAGWRLENYLKNPVVLWAHNASTYPIARCTSIGLENGNLTASVEFVPVDVPVAGQLAEAVYQLCLKGFLKGVSVGFRPLEWEFTEDKARGADEYDGGVDFISQELMEFSVCSIPANPDALIVPAEEPDQSEETDKQVELLNTQTSSRLRLQMKLRILEL